VDRLAKALGFEEKDRQYIRLMESAQFKGKSVKPIVFSCVELGYLNSILLKADSKTQISVRLALRLIIQGVEASKE
jgi:hypothetical protein